MKYKVSLNGKDYIVEVEKGEAIMVDVQDTPIATPPVAPTAPVAAVAAPVANSAPVANLTGEVVEAPMNGLILSVAVQAGSMVKEGDVLVVLEAMKMENEIVAPRDAKVLSIITSKGSNVETGQALLTLE